MATTSEHFNLNIGTGSDVVNPLVDTFPNFETIDEVMFANQNASVGTASEIKTGNVHALTRVNGDNNTFRFVATSVFNSGDSFTVDGVSVTALLPSGESLDDNAYVIGSNVLCILTSTELTVFTTGGTASNSKALNGQNAAYYLNSANENFDNTGTNINATKVEGAIKELDVSVNQTNVNSYQDNRILGFKSGKMGCLHTVGNGAILPITNGNVLPANLRPATTTCFPVATQNDTDEYWGRYNVDGTIDVFKGGNSITTATSFCQFNFTFLLG